MKDSEEGTPPLSILIVDDEPSIRRTLTISLEAEGHKVKAVGNSKDALSEAARGYFDLALVDLRLGTESGMDLIPSLRASCPWMKIVVITAYASIDSAVEAMRRGAFDYLPKPFTHDQVAMLTRKTAQVRVMEQRLETLQEMLSAVAPEADFASRNPAMQRVFEMAKRVAESEATVLITGESGTGKTILAHAIHSWSPRASKPFCSVSCPSLSAELLESELFGHARGAFTGAVKDFPGRIAGCQGGTLFLDEIGDIPLSIQPKLLRLLQEKTFERLGDLHTRKADVRIIAATNIDLEEAVRARRFREDLYYRINVVELDLPPLRERREDILPITERLLVFFARQNHRPLPELTKEATQVIQSHDWPGNIRELRNAIERAALLATGDRIEVEHLPIRVVSSSTEPAIGDQVPLETIEEMHIRRVLASTSSIEEAARILGMDTVTLWRRRKKYGI
ncbi:MAG: sigma-54-dependent transcriptional regulator [Acidobacteriota bacterium]